MRYFRHPPLLIWTAVACGLLLLFAAAAQQPAPTAADTTTSRSVSTDAVLSLHARIPTLLTLADQPDEQLTRWADTTAQLATDSAEQRGSDDQLTAAFHTVAAHAETLAGTDPADIDATDAAVRKLLAALDQLTAAWTAPHTPEPAP